MDDHIVLNYRYKEININSVHSVIAHDDTDKLIKLSFRGANLNSVDDDGITPIMIACYTGNMRIINFLLSKKVNFDYQTYKNKYFALLYAIKNNNFEVVNLLIEKVNIKLLDRNKNNILYYLLDYIDFSLFNKYYKKFDLNHKNLDGDNLLLFAVKKDMK